MSYQVLFHRIKGRENEQSDCLSFAKLDRLNAAEKNQYFDKNRSNFNLQIKILAMIPHNRHFGEVDFL